MRHYPVKSLALVSLVHSDCSCCCKPINGDGMKNLIVRVRSLSSCGFAVLWGCRPADACRKLPLLTFSKRLSFFLHFYLKPYAGKGLHIECQERRQANRLAFAIRDATILLFRIIIPFTRRTKGDN